MRPRFPLQPSFETRANARSSEPDRKCIQHFQALSNHLKMILFFVMPGKKREARLRARCPGHPRLSCLSAAKTWMPGTRPGMTSFTRKPRSIGCVQDDGFAISPKIPPRGDADLQL